MKTRARLPRLVATGVTLALALSLSACGDGNGGASSTTASPCPGLRGRHQQGRTADRRHLQQDVRRQGGARHHPRCRLPEEAPDDHQHPPQAPDVFFNWGGGSIRLFVKADLLLPLDDFIKKNPDLKQKFLPSVFDSAVVDGKPYGIPMRGTQPVLLFHNKQVLDEAGGRAPKTWDELLDAVEKLRDEGVTPIALGGGDVWPTQMWFQYLYDRIAGPELFAKAVGGDKSAWESADSKKALDMIKELVDTGAFGRNYDSVKYTNGGSVQLVASGKAGFELMGSWYYSQQLTDHQEFAEKDLGYTAFPGRRGRQGRPGQRRRQHQQLLLGDKKTERPGGRRRVPEAHVLRRLRQGAVGHRQPADHDQHRRVHRDLGHPRVLALPVRPRRRRPVVPAVLGPGVPAEGEFGHAQGRPAVLQRTARHGRLHQGHAGPPDRVTNGS